MAVQVEDDEDEDEDEDENDDNDDDDNHDASDALEPQAVQVITVSCHFHTPLKIRFFAKKGMNLEKCPFSNRNTV